MKVGPRQAMAAASIAFGGGLVVGAAGLHFHSLPLLYLGYGFLGGTGIGLAYTPPVQTLMQVLLSGSILACPNKSSCTIIPSGFQIKKESHLDSLSQALVLARWCSLHVCST